MKKKQKTTLLILCSILFLMGLYFFCEWQTHGLRFYHLLSTIQNDARWDTPSLSVKENIRINTLIDQPFTFLAKGSFCYAFLGKDQKTVLKFYKHTDFTPLSFFPSFSWDKLLLKGPLSVSALTPHMEFLFKSCMLLFSRVNEKTGLIYIHLNKSEHLLSPAILIDNIGVRHTIDLNQTEFVLQQKAESLIDYIERSIEEHKKDNAKQAIDSYFDCLLTLCKRGLRDLDRGFKDNYGILDNGVVITMDISSFIEDISLQRSGEYKKEIVLKSHNLAKWLKKHHPDLYAYYHEKLTALIENA